MMLADIVRSAGEIDNRTLLEELDGLCSALDCALANGHRVLW
jgi:DNA-binding Xre family transcriptional regulator